MSGWIQWINYVAARCCQQLTCMGFDTQGHLRWAWPERRHWKKSAKAQISSSSLRLFEVWLYEKYRAVPSQDEAQVSSPLQHGPGSILPVQGSQTMDWVLSLDVGQEIPEASQEGFLDNVARLAGRGAVISWPQETRWLQSLQARGLHVDWPLTHELRLFAGHSGL